MEKEEKWALSISNNYSLQIQEKEDEDEDEALSLCDLPIIHHQFKKETEEETKNEAQEDFDFCSITKDSKMCAADEVFFQGQILPLRHSISSETGLLQFWNGTRSVSRSQSMDHSYSGGLISSRSSSISSHQSSSSGSSSYAAGRWRHPKPPRNQFHSHPSPSPRIHPPNRKHGSILNPTNHISNSYKKSSVWSVFRLGLVTPPPEIAIQDLRTRNRTNCKNFGSRNSNSSNSSSLSNDSSKKNEKSEENKKLKKSKSRSGFLSGCKCSINDAVPSRTVIIKRSASESEETRVLRLEDEEEEEEENVQPTKIMKRQESKKRLSHHRTFEWLKQLSIDGAEEDDGA